MLPPAFDRVGRVQLSTSFSFETTHYNNPSVVNQKYHIQKCNNDASLCLSKVGAQPPFQFERREIYLYLSLCAVVMPQTNINFVLGVVFYVF